MTRTWTARERRCEPTGPATAAAPVDALPATNGEGIPCW